jgi:hypothetical protein
MPIAPAPFIQGQTSWQMVDYSGVAFDFNKLLSMPPSLFEWRGNHGYKEHLDQRDVWEIQRVFRYN